MQLKDLIVRWKKQTGKDSILYATIDWTTNPPTVEEKTLDEIDLVMYDSITEYYFYSDIGFDDDYQFIQRFNTYWEMKRLEYRSMIELAIEKGYGRTIRSYNGDDKKTGTDTFGKNTTSTSSQTTSNTGDKKTRLVPTENLEVTGSNDVTVRDTGDDTTTYDNNLNKSYTEEYIDLTPAVVYQAIKNTSLLKSWVDEFYKLFSEVL